MGTPKIIGLAEPVKPKIIGLADEPEEEQYLQPKQEGFLSKLPRNIASGLAMLGHRATNMPYESAKEIQNLSEPFGEFQRQNLPALQGKQKQQSYLEQSMNKFKQEHDIPQELINPNWGFNVENIPHQQEQNYPQMFGQEGEGTMMDKLIQGGIAYAPDIASLGSLVKSGAKALLPMAGERISNLSNYKKLKEQLLRMEKKGSIAQESANEAGISAEEATKQIDALKEPEEISKYLNVGFEHDVRGAKAIQHRLKNIENYWKTGYKDLKNNLRDSEFHMENMPEYEEKISSLIDDFELSQVGEKPEVSAELRAIIHKAPTPKDIKADDFLTKYQDFRDARYDLLQRTKDPKTSAAERKSLFKAYEDSKPIEEAVKDALNKGLGPHKAEFERINKGYSEQIYPLRSNIVAKKALSGKLGPNTINDLSGTGEGQELMREIVKQDPELMRNILGQRYAKNPSKLHELDEKTAEYLAESPELQKMLDENLDSINKKLEEVNKHKESKSISLKQKLDAEKESKELREKVRAITKDRIKIRRATKKILKGTAYTTLAIGGIKSINSLLK